MMHNKLLLLIGMLLCIGSAWAADMNAVGRTHALPMWFRNNSGVMFTDADNGVVFAYASDVADTSGTTIHAAYDATYQTWTFTDATTDLYTIKHDDDGGETTLLDGWGLAGKLLGDSQIDRAACFDTLVVPGFAIKDDAVWPRMINADSSYTITLGSIDATTETAIEAVIDLSQIQGNTAPNLSDIVSNTKTAGFIFVNDGATGMVGVVMSGEATINANGAIALGHDALDDQYYDSEADLTGLLDDDYVDEAQANSIDSDMYVDGSIDAEHLAPDIVDETKIADDGIDSEHYNDDSIDNPHINWADIDNLTDEGALVSGTDPDVNAAGEISVDTDGANETGDMITRGFDGSNQVCMNRKIHTAQINVVAPNDLDDAIRDKCKIFDNDTGMTATIIRITGESLNTDDAAFDVEEYDADGASNVSTVDAVNCTTGSGPYLANETTITAGTIEAGHKVYVDFDDTDTPTAVAVKIFYWLNADVD